MFLAQGNLRKTIPSPTRVTRRDFTGHRDAPSLMCFLFLDSKLTVGASVCSACFVTTSDRGLTFTFACSCSITRRWANLSTAIQRNITKTISSSLHCVNSVLSSHHCLHYHRESSRKYWPLSEGSRVPQDTVISCAPPRLGALLLMLGLFATETRITGVGVNWQIVCHTPNEEALAATWCTRKTQREGN